RGPDALAQPSRQNAGPPRINPVIFVAVFAGGLALGLLVGRWWIVLAPVAFGAWIAATTGVDEVPPSFLGLAYALPGALGVGIGVIVRRRRLARSGISATP